MNKGVQLIFFAAITLFLGCSEDIGAPNENVSHGVTMANVEKFKSELLEKLPTGTPVSDVLEEFKRLELEHTYVPSEKTVFAIVPKIGKFRLVYDTSLLIRVHLDENEQVDHIEFLLEHTGL